MKPKYRLPIRMALNHVSMKNPNGNLCLAPDLSMLKKPVLLLAAVLVIAATAARAGTLDQIKKRGFLTCGSNPGRAGLSLPDGHGHWAGLDIDFCRALAAAIFGNAGKVKFVPLTAKDRFAALQFRAVGVLA